MNLLLLSSCLGSSNDVDFEYSSDAQIYSFSLSSKADTLNVLRATKFSIDQINGRIFNKEPLPYQFHVDSVSLNIRSSSSLDAFFNISVQLIPDSTFFLTQTDSIDVSRLNRITTTASDGENKKTYQFQLNIYQKDPFILSWEEISEGYLPPATEQQKTVAFNNRFITFYIANGKVHAASTPIEDGETWTYAELPELPPEIIMSTVTAAENALFMIDDENRLFRSSDGYSWMQVSTDYPVVAIYGKLPSATKGDILVMVNDNGTLKLAETDDFSTLHLMKMDAFSNLSDLPIKNLSISQIESKTSYAIKYIAMAGGSKTDNSYNNDVWIIQEKNNAITVLKSKVSDSISLEGSSIFFYDEKPYIFVASSEKNSLIYSENNGTEWKATEENQAIPRSLSYRKNATVITENNNIWIFGGVSQTQTQITDVWKGRLNKFDLN